MSDTKISEAAVEAAAKALAKWAGHSDGKVWMHEARSALAAAVPLLDPPEVLMCSDCQSPVLFECPSCSNMNYPFLGETEVPWAAPGGGDWSKGWNACREATLRGDVFPADAGLPHLHPQPAELAEQQGVELPPLPEAHDMGYYIDSTMRKGTMTGYTRQQMRDYARTALAATGKQQVGEVPGVREQFEAWARKFGHDLTRRSIGREGDDSYIDDFALYAWTAWKAALAARQPGDK